MRLSVGRPAVRRIAALLCAVVSAGCGADELPRLGQVLLYVDTDAPLPPPPGQAPGPDDPPALFDTVRVDVFSPDGACSPCSHEFAVDRERIGPGASLGILPAAGVPGYVARVRLFRAALVKGDQPRVDSTIDRTVALPEVAEGRIDELTVDLPTDEVGVAVGTLQAPHPARTVRPFVSAVGSWPGARRLDCDDAPADDEVCVPGGAYWMGNPAMSTSQLTEPVDRQRLVVVSPFYLDKTEVTVARFRASGLAVENDPVISPNTGGDDLNDWCTYTDAPGALEDHPVNCISWRRAEAYCESLGKQLPTEASYEYVASALRSADYNWGADDPSCSDAVFGRAGYGALASASAPCKPQVGIGGPLPSGSGARDALTLATGTVVDLAGNVREHAVDLWNMQDEACWTFTVGQDPICEQPSAEPRRGTARAVRGGSWLDLRRRLMAASRDLLGETETDAATGFRCARRP